MSDYCVLADIHVRLQDLSTDYDTLITELCGEASKIFTREAAGRRFDKTTATKYFRGKGKRKLFIPEIATLTSVRVRTTVTGSWRTVALTPAEGDRLGDVVLGPTDREAGDPATILTIIDTPAGPDLVWPLGDALVEIVGDWGFLTVPTDVKDACVELVVAMLRDRGVGTSSPTGVGELAQDGRPRTYPDVTYRTMQQRKAVLVA